MVATVFRLLVFVEYFNSTPPTFTAHFWYTNGTWASTEHGLSLFASSILALKPVVHLVSKSWTNLISGLGGSKKSTGRDTPGEGGALKLSNWTYSHPGTDLESIGSIQEGDRRHSPFYAAKFNGSNDSQRDLVRGAGSYSGAEKFV